MTCINNNGESLQAIDKLKSEINFSNNYSYNMAEEQDNETDNERRLATEEGELLLNKKLTEINNKLSSVTTISKLKPSLPLARIKRIMKTDKNVRMLSIETSSVFAKACELLIVELACKSIIFAGQKKRKTIQKSDIKKVVFSNQNFDFMLDVVEGSYKRSMHKYSEEFFAANIDHEKMIKKMTFPNFNKRNEPSTSIGHVILDNTTSSGIVQMYLDHYKRHDKKKLSK